MFEDVAESAPCSASHVSRLQAMPWGWLTYSLCNALLAVSHEQISDLVDYGVVAVLDVTSQTSVLASPVLWTQTGGLRGPCRYRCFHLTVSS